MADLIERQAAIDAFDKQFWSLFNIPICKEIRNAAKETIKTLPSAQPETRTFVELVVEYPDPELCTYKEFKGKPYYSIKYTENGETYVGYGTYNPEVLSRYLKEYFMPSAQPEPCEDAISRQAAIDAMSEALKRVFPEHRQIAEKCLNALPSAQPEQLTDKEQRIFLAAMGREEKVCKQVDHECRKCREPYEDSLMWVCHEITRKVKAALWET